LFAACVYTETQWETHPLLHVVTPPITVRVGISGSLT
jgi:hypothetical protein